MNRFAGSRGFILAVVLFAVTLLGVASLGQARAAQTDGARLTIHNRICPSGFTGPDFYGTCHDTAPNPGLPFSISGPEPGSGTTDANGDITFGGLIPGPYTVSGGVPGEFAEVTYFCARRATPSVAFPFSVVTTGISVTLADTDDVVCDWYNSPIDLSGLPTATPVVEAATLTVYAAICPVDFSGESYFDECFDRPAEAASVVFLLSAGGVALTEQAVGDDGHAQFNGVQAGTYLLSDSVPGDFLDGRFVYCTFDGGSPVTYDLPYTENAIEITIGAGQAVACDWYIEPADQGVTPTATVAAPTATARPAGPTATTGAVVGLPNTGAGGALGSVASDGLVSMWLTSAVLALFGTFGLIVAARRRVQPVVRGGTMRG